MEDTIEQLKKKQRLMIAIITILAFITLTSFVYSNVQQGIAQENERLTIENHTLAVTQSEELVKCRQDLERQQKIAEMNAMEALRQNQRAEEALAKVKK